MAMLRAAKATSINILPKYLAPDQENILSE
jgi:hypothetical protein